MRGSSARHPGPTPPPTGIIVETAGAEVDPHGSTDTAPNLVDPSPGTKHARGSSVEMRRPPVPLRWQTWPAGDEPGTTLILLLVFLTVGGAVAVATANLGWGLVAFVAVALTTARHWTTTNYETNREGLQIEAFGRVRRLRWTNVHGWYEGRRGVWLIAPRAPLPWEWIGGVYLAWPVHRDALRSTLGHYLGPASKSVSSP
ncbi:MAG: hypothetical protein K1X74_17575 [Pirellulales bacterium]|nr:hypothetical protein [Pirellulales bacterium]